MSYHEMVKEFQQDNIAPVLALVKDTKTTILMFSNAKVAKQFARRNLPKDWINGNLLVHEDDFETIKKAGWETYRFTFPRRLRDTEGTLTVEIMEFTRDVEVRRA